MHVDSNESVRIVELRPRPALRPHVERFLIAEFPRHHRDTHFPNTRPVAAFTLGGRVDLDHSVCAPAAAFTGVNDTLRTHEHLQHHSVVLVTFTSVGAAAFLRPPLEEFTQNTADLAGLLGRPSELERLRDQLANAPSDAVRISHVEDFLLPKVRVPSPDPLVSSAVAWLERAS